MKYERPQIIEIMMPGRDNHCEICNSEAFSCFLNIDERNEFLQRKES